MNLLWPIEWCDWCQWELQWIILPQMSTGCRHRVRTHSHTRTERQTDERQEWEVSSVHGVTELQRRCRRAQSHVHAIINYHCVLHFDWVGWVFYNRVCILLTVLYKSRGMWLPRSRHTQIHIHMNRQGISLAFTVIALCLRGLRGSQVCPARERSGLKGSLSTYTLTENQSIVRAVGWVCRGVREGKEERGRKRRS